MFCLHWRLSCDWSILFFPTQGLPGSELHRVPEKRGQRHRLPADELHRPAGQRGHSGVAGLRQQGSQTGQEEAQGICGVTVPEPICMCLCGVTVPEPICMCLCGVTGPDPICMCLAVWMLFIFTSHFVCSFPKDCKECISQRTDMFLCCTTPCYAFLLYFLLLYQIVHSILHFCATLLYSSVPH